MNDRSALILGPDGNPMRRAPAPAAPRRRSLALNGGWGNTPYDAADITGAHMSAWNPLLWSPDVELNIYRDRIVSRVRDLVRNDGWASGTITRVLDNAIGGSFRAISKPDYRALRVKTGFAFDAAWADEWGRVVDSHWRSFAEDENRYCDVGRRLTFTQICWSAMRHDLVDGDALAQVCWLPERIGRGRAEYATTFNLIDPDRLSVPQNNWDMEFCRGGVQIDEWGAPIGYHIRAAHQGDWFAAAKSQQWNFIARETAWGRPNVVHHFQTERAGQHRGGAGILAPVVQRLKMLIKYDGTELDAAIVNAIFGAYVESPFDQEMVADALGGGEAGSAYQDLRSEFHGGNRVMLGDVRMPMLAPGEKINTVSAARPASNFRDFEGAILRNVASGAGVSAMQVSNDWSDVNYSSARAALIEAWKTMSRRRQNFAQGFASPLRSSWLEECVTLHDLPMPAGVPKDFLARHFPDLKTPLSRCKWLGPGRGYIDPVAERKGSIMGLDAGLTTLEEEIAENSGADWEETADQRAVEVRRYRELGLPLPEWAINELNADQASQPKERDAI
ncbi:phage portal protein [Asaia spathodeae]|uniref:Phage portal protein n=1 Tax=Asaia spathodeae TaxID=657016 RepID=A0ABX2P7L4_9PROT|nr:phage portal protein [Asaia spathodeae]GBR21059.1 bacteriophage capsid structural protein [Asaia spathodeae NBRC 105894]